jgi:hypothetical protein
MLNIKSKKDLNEKIKSVGMIKDSHILDNKTLW